MKQTKSEEEKKQERITKEYIGITGFKTQYEIKETTKSLHEANITEIGLTGMYGFLIMDYQLLDIRNAGHRRPALKNLKTLIETVPEDMMPTIHYCSRTRTLDLENLTKILKYDDVHKVCKYLQINLDWPEPEKIKKLKNKFPDLYIIQQLNPEHEDTKKNIETYLKEYEGYVDKLLIDPSLGAGIPYDVKESAKIINEINKKHTNYSYVVCGGLSDTNVYNRIIEITPMINTKFSIDAEGRLRTDNGEELDLKKTNKYIHEAAKGLKKT